MVLIEESVPAVAINHVVLPFADNFSQILEVPFARTELPEVTVIDTDAMDTGINGRSPPDADLRLRSVDVGPYISNWKIISNSLRSLLIAFNTSPGSSTHGISPTVSVLSRTSALISCRNSCILGPLAQ